MKIRIQSYRRFNVIGSAMEVWPTGNYIEYMPKGTPQERLGQSWQRVGNVFEKSIKAYELKHSG